VKTLKDYIKRLQEHYAKENGPATYEALAGILGVSTATVGNLRKGRPSKRDLTIEMADQAGLSRVEFLEAAGYIPDAEDKEWDQGHSVIRFTPELSERKNVHPLYLADGTPDVPEELRDFEIFGQVKSARGIQAEGIVGCGELEDWLDTPAVALMRELGGDFVIKLTGDSMQPRLNPGDYAIIRLNPEMETGRIYIIEVDGQLTCKTYAGVHEEDGETIYRFEPANHRYGAINAKEVTIRGRVVGRIELDF
jgi:SOS-response transcriptional repressor LexA